MTFDGVHEVRALRPSGVAVGYFDSFDLATAAVEREADYRAIYFSLNPVDPAKVPALNPPTLKPSANTAADADVSRRVRLMLDFDPIRPANCSATDSEKATAVDQAEAARRFLSSRGWPSPMVADSGNGVHLLYRIDLPNDAASTALVRGVLNGLKERFPLLDSGNFNASRICKFYGSWSRKGPHTDDRPHRRSVILEDGEDTPVTAEQLQALAPVKPKALIAKPHDIKLAGLTGFLQHYAVVARSEPREVAGGWQIAIECPWAAEHSSEGSRDTVVSFVDGAGYGFKCLHSHCTDRHWREFRAELEKRTSREYRFDTPEVVIGSPGLPLISHATLAEAFLRSNRDFVSVYDLPGRPTAQWVGTRWDIKSDDTLLYGAVVTFLKGLFAKYPAPEKGADHRMRLYDAVFAGGVVRSLKPFLQPVRSSAFDRDPYLLGLPDCRVIDLRTGAVRTMVREDYITRRIDVTADPNQGTPIFDRFMGEITMGDAGLANYLLRLGALCLTATSYRGLFFLWGKGGNGKSVFIETLSSILGPNADGFALTLRPDQVTVSKFGDEAAKRTLADFEGKRLVTVNESVGGNLNVSLLKLMSGEDVLTGAKMRQDARQFRPTHKVLLPTNDKPHLPADDAFRGRVHMIPFNASFKGREDRQLKDKLRGEYPGILYRLLTLCPDVIVNGLRPPACVLGETDRLLEELDLTRQFVEDCTTTGETTLEDMQRAVGDWLRALHKFSDDSLETILRELKEQPGVSYTRARRGASKARVRVYVGLGLSQASDP